MAKGKARDGRIVVDPKVMLGKPVVRGTRIIAPILLEKLAAGLNAEEVLKDYPQLDAGHPRCARIRISRRGCGGSPTPSSGIAALGWGSHHGGGAFSAVPCGRSRLRRQPQERIRHRAIATAKIAAMHPEAPQAGPSHADWIPLVRLRRTSTPLRSSPPTATEKTGSENAGLFGSEGTGRG